MKKSSLRTRCLAGSALVAVLAPFAIPAAQAQDQGGEAVAMDQIVVTGTRIRRPNLESNSPLTVVSDAEIKYQGATGVENVLNRMPQFTPDATEYVSNGSDGTANINLRDLGSNRVLVLLDGQRVMPTQAMDVNFIPTTLVERIDVVTGGASAVYGSDAISGVVNFITRKKLEGVRVDAQYSFHQHENDNKFLRNLVRSHGYDTAPGSVTDGSKYEVSIAAGTNFADGKGNVTMYAGYRKVRPVLQKSRDYSACALDPAGENNNTLRCGGSSNSPWGQFTVIADPITGSPATYNNPKTGEKVWVPSDSSYLYNYAPENYIQRSDVRYTAGAFAHYELSPSAELYGSFMFMDDHTWSQAAYSGMWLGDNYAINCNNPLMSAQQASLLCGDAAGSDEVRSLYVGFRPDGEGAAPRRDSLRHTNYRFTGGIRGDITDAISYDVGVVHTTVIFDESYKNDIDPAKARNALLVVDVDGVPTCLSVVNKTDMNCVPLDVFGYNKTNAQALGYVYAPTFTRGVQKLSVANATISGDLGSYGLVSPWASNGIGFAIGFEHRRETLRFEADALAQAKGTLESQGEIKVNEFYAEIGIPLLENLPFARSLSINGGFRYSEYTNDSLAGTVTKYNASTYKGELDYAPSRDVRFRASYNHAIRAPNINELFASQGLGNVQAVDPCAGSSPVASLEQCRLTGVTPERYGRIPECPAAQCVAQSGGNPMLKPEEADTYTFGVVLTPTVLPNFSLSVDYFNIKVDGYISSVDPYLTINQCIETGNPYFCGLFHRDPTTGVLFGTNGYVIATTLNTGYLKTSGIDVSAAYRFDLEDIGLNNAGRVSIDLVGTYLDKSVVQQLPGLGTYDCAGLFGPTCGQPTPDWRHNMRTTWEMPWANATLSLNWRYFGGTKLSVNTDNEYLKGTYHEFNRKLKAYNYFDLSGTVEVWKGIIMRAGINNLFDKAPPAIAQNLLASYGNGNTYPGVYDPLGRTIFIGLTAEF